MISSQAEPVFNTTQVLYRHMGSWGRDQMTPGQKPEKGVAANLETAARIINDF